MATDRWLTWFGIGALLAALVLVGLAFTTASTYGGGCESLLLPFLPCSVLSGFYSIGEFLILLGVALLALGYFESRRNRRSVPLRP